MKATKGTSMTGSELVKHADEQAKLYESDRVAIDQAIYWLKNFWWENRGVGPRTAQQAVFETDRAILALINLKNAPPFEKLSNE